MTTPAPTLHLFRFGPAASRIVAAARLTDGLHSIAGRGCLALLLGTATLFLGTAPLAAAIGVGKTVRVTENNVNIRSSYGTSASVVGQQHTGAQGTVTQGPQSANGYTWWRVDFNSGADGWVASNYLQEVVSSGTVDIQPLNVTRSPTSVAPGGSLAVNWQIRNNGTASAGSSSSQVRITTSSSSYGNSSNNVGSPVSTGTISAGSTISQNRTVTAPSSPGTYYVWVVADNNSVLNQTNTSNDYAVSSSFTVTAPASTVDVQPLNVTRSPASVAPGGNLAVNWQIRNNGTGTAVSSNSQVRITTSSSSYGNSSNNVGSPVSTGTISAGSTISQNRTVTAPSSPGTYYVWVVADNNSVLNQTNTSNDYAVSPSFTVAAPATPAPSISGISPTSMPTSTSDQTLTINGSNFVSGATLTFDPPTGNDISSNASKLTFVSSSQIRYQLNNANDAGTWRVQVRNPDGKTSGWTSFTVTAPATPTPSISGVSPTSMPASTSDQTLTINGSNFVSGATLTFDPPTGSDISSNASKLTFVSSSQIRYQINNANDAGTWRVRVNNPGGKTSGWASFTVTAPAIPGAFTLSHETPYWDSRSPAGPAVLLKWTQASGATSYELYRNGSLVKGGLNALYFTNELGMSAGQTYNFQIVARNANGVRSSNTVSVGPMPGAPVAAPRPDLIVVPGSITFSPSSVQAGGSFHVNFQIRNIGPGSAPPTKARLRLSLDSVLTSSDPPLSPLDMNVPALAAGETRGLGGAVQVPANTPQGQYHVGVFADAGSTAGQSNETNDAGLSTGKLAVSPVAGLTPPVITQQPGPANIYLNSGGILDLNVTATGSDLKFQWMRNNAEIDGQKWNQLNISVSADNEGEYWVKVSNSAGSTHSNKVTVAVDSSNIPPRQRPVKGELKYKETFNPNLPTVIITHGWQPDEASNPLSDWMEPMRNAILSRLNQQVNVFLYTWPQSFTYDSDTGPVGSYWPDTVRATYSSTDTQGQFLANFLAPMIGSKAYSQKIHFIGHSFGTFVNARAVEGLTDKTIDHFTILDAPIDLTSNKFLDQPGIRNFFDTHLPRSRIVYLDNYIASKFTGKLWSNFGAPVFGAKPGSGGLKVSHVIHSTIHKEYYLRTVDPATSNQYPHGFNDSILVNPNRETIFTPSKPSMAAVIKSLPEGASVTLRNTQELGVEVRQLFVSGYRLLTNWILPSPSESPMGSLAKTSPQAAALDSDDAKLEFDLTIPADADLLAFDFLFVAPGDGDWMSVTFNGEPLYVFSGESFYGTEYHQAEAPIAHFAGRAGVLSVTLHSESEEVSEVRAANFKFLTLPKRSAAGTLNRPTNLRVVRSSTGGSRARVTLSLRDNSTGETSHSIWKQEKRKGRGWKSWRRAKTFRGTTSTGTIRSTLSVPKRTLHKFRASATDGRRIFYSNQTRHKSR